MRTDYVSEFTQFINQYLVQHPEVVADQKVGWDIFWDHKVDLQALEDAKKDVVPDDCYGFYPTDWRGKPGPKKEPA